MKHLCMGLFLVGLIQTGYSQEHYFTVALDNKTSILGLTNVHVVEDANSDNIAFFAMEKKITYAYFYNGDKQRQAQLTTKGLKGKYPEILGQIMQGRKIRLIQKSSFGDKFASILYDFDKGETLELEYDIDTKGYAYLQGHSYDSKIYLITIQKNSSTLRKWIFELDGNYTFEDYDVTNELAKAGIKNTSLSEIIRIFNSVKKVDVSVPNTIEIACERNKVYDEEDQFVYTFDKEHEYTVVISFSYPNFEPEVTVITKPEPIDASQKVAASNSFIIDDVFAHVISNNRMIVLDFKHRGSFETIKRHEVQKDDDISFRNSPILQEGGTYNFGPRKMEKASKFLRKISSSKNGVSIYKTAQGYRAVIGGIKNLSEGGGMAPEFGLPTTSFGNMTVAVNPVAFAYGSYSNTKSIRIESLFDENFEHIPGELEDNIFDIITAKVERVPKNTDNIFRIDGKILFGNYFSDVKEYRFYSFQMLDLHQFSRD